MNIFLNRATETNEIDKRRLKFERSLYVDLQKITNHLSGEIVSSFKTSRQTTIINIVDNYKDDIVAALKASYREVSSTFGVWNRNKFNALNRESIFDVKEIKSDVQHLYNIGLSDFVNEAATIHSEYIIETMKDDIYRSASSSQEVVANELQNYQNEIDHIQKRLFELRSLDIIDKKLISERSKLLSRTDDLQKASEQLRQDKDSKTVDVLGQALRQTNKQRNEMRAYQETSYAQVTTMQLEAESMEKEDKDIRVGLFAGLTIALLLFKEWDGIRDGHQRRDHMLANGQKRKITEPFLVGDELGMTPRADTFSMKNKARCRCHVVYGFSK